MANTMSSKKNIRSSARKKAHNQMWKRTIREVVKTIKEQMISKATGTELSQSLQKLQKVLDKASKNKVIHKNKANRLKSMYARKTTTVLSTTSTGSATATGRKAKKK
jgi:small subunit ribosomal protein S20